MSVVIWCFLIGAEGTFSVLIDGTGSVDDLKEEIKKKVALDHANHLKLYKVLVTQPGNKSNRISQLNRLSQQLNEDQVLDEEMQISDIFSEPHQGQKYYVVVQTPNGEPIYCGGVVLMADVR